MKEVWAGRAIQVAGTYGENAPMATVCCNACRTCVTTNLIGIATAGFGAVGIARARFASRFARSSY